MFRALKLADGVVSFSASVVCHLLLTQTSFSLLLIVVGMWWQSKKCLVVAQELCI